MSDTESASRVVRGACHHDCPDTCGWQVTVEGSGLSEQAVQLRGDPAHPYSKGELCPKVNRFLDRVYSPDRVLHPLRAGARARPEQITGRSVTETPAASKTSPPHGPEALMPYVSR